MPPAECAMTDMVVEPGARSDLAAMVRWHYRTALPATVSHVLVARCSWLPEIAGVLAISMPAINGPWRASAWPELARPEGLAREADRRAAMRAINAEVRVISRVIVDPRVRGMGIATGLVRTYLAAPITARTEVIAAMAEACPIFERAGMREAACPPASRVAALRRVLGELDVEPWRMADPRGLCERLTADGRARLERALRVFADAHRDTRALARGDRTDLQQLIAAAARRVATTRRVFVSP